MTSKRQLEQEIEQLQARVRALEEDQPLPKPVPAGWYHATVDSVERKLTGFGRAYWSVRYRISASPSHGRMLWASYPDHTTSPAEELARELGVKLERPVVMTDWQDDMQRLVGKRVRVNVRTRPHFSRPGEEMSEIVETQAAA